MKKLIQTLVLAFGLVLPAFSFAGSFGGEKFVSSDPSMGAQFPEIAYHNGVIHVVFIASGGNVMYARSTVATGTFSAPVNLSQGVSTNSDRAHVTAGPSGVVAGWNSDGTTGAIYTRRSFDAGQSWQGGQLVSGAEGDGFYHRLTQMYTDTGGRVHMAYYTNADNAGLAGQIHHRMSCDGGATWSTDVTVTSQLVDGDVDNEQPRVSEAGGRFNLVFRSTRNGNPQGGWAPFSIIYQSGTLAGCQVNWSYPGRRVAGGIPFTYGSTYRPEVYADSSGWLHVAWWENTFGANVHYRRAGNVSFEAPQQMSNFGVNHLEPGGLNNSGGSQQPPTLASNGTFTWLAYSRNTAVTAGFEHGVVVLRESSSAGATFGGEATIATSAAGLTPRMAVDTGNSQNLGIVWTDMGGGTPRVKYRLYTLGAVSGGPSFSLSPDPLAFGNRPVGSSQLLNVTVLNTGTAGSISGVAITGTKPDDYAITSNTCGGAIGAGASCVVGVTFTAQGLGSRPANLTVTSDSIDSPNSSSLTGTGINGATFADNVNAVITGYYETILGRFPDAGGRAFWSNEATRVNGLGASVKEAFFAMSLSFFNSGEYTARNTSNTQYVTDLYRTFFIREPDAGGLAFWQGYLDQGLDRGALLTNFLFSAEFDAFMTNLFGNPAVRPEVNMTIDFFRGILGRLPDNGGFNFWLSQLRTAQCQGAGAVSAKVNELAQNFAGSGEYVARENARPAGERTKMHVGDLYNAFLRRGAEPGGYNHWVNQINGGFMTRDQVRNQFVGSSEFQTRVTAVINAGCLTP